ncbi:MAG: RdgB/HAM1 family non-canonical purine NTP pyrophosphatase [Gammaproteobacteria bacterium]|nr:RdgB/HAM1 family non-canonical purine NTP pyrophosphatase [Gammaproteobacteria bacterium]
MASRDATIVLASSNPGKLGEIRAILRGTGLAVRPQGELDVADAPETGQTFIENAIIKARNASLATGLPALADDSGLCVDALGGEPGVRSARYAGSAATDADNVAKLMATLSSVADGLRTARFQCVIALLRHAADPTPIICQGSWDGTIGTAPAGSNGFGYDPVFQVPAHGCSAAELDSDTKNRISHRGRALAELKRQLVSLEDL